MTNENNHEKIAPSGTLIMLRGIPGVGKSTLAAKIMETVGSKAIGINPDDCRYKEGYFDNSHSNEVDVFASLDKIAKDYLKSGGIVIWQQVWTTLKTDKDLQTEIKDKFNPNRLLLVEIDIPNDVAWERVVHRESLGGQQRITRAEFDFYVNEYTSLKESISGKELISINGQDDVRQNLEIIIGWLKRMMVI